VIGVGAACADEVDADDYLGKPFAFAELTARVRALCRREQPARPSELRVADLELDFARRRVRRDGVLLGLTTKEFAVLEVLIMGACDLCVGGSGALVRLVCGFTVTGVFLRLRLWCGGLVGGAVRWCAVCCAGGRRWGVCTTARRSESLRMRWVGGRRSCVVGA
jgi:hypothetical protein